MFEDTEFKSDMDRWKSEANSRFVSPYQHRKFKYSVDQLEFLPTRFSDLMIDWFRSELSNHKFGIPIHVTRVQFKQAHQTWDLGEFVFFESRAEQPQWIKAIRNTKAIPGQCVVNPLSGVWKGVATRYKSQLTLLT